MPRRKVIIMFYNLKFKKKFLKGNAFWSILIVLALILFLLFASCQSNKDKIKEIAIEQAKEMFEKQLEVEKQKLLSEMRVEAQKEIQNEKDKIVNSAYSFWNTIVYILLIALLLMAIIILFPYIVNIMIRDVDVSKENEIKGDDKNEP